MQSQLWTEFEIHGPWGMNELQHTLRAKNNVSPMEPKYAAVKGSRGVDMRCWAYVIGPIKTAHDAKNSTEPIVHLNRTYERQHKRVRILKGASECEVKQCYFRQSKQLLDRLHLAAVEAHHAPFQKVVYV